MCFDSGSLLLGVFGCRWEDFVGPLSHSREGSLQINVLFWMVTFILWWNISVLMRVVFSRMTMPSSTGQGRSLIGLKEMMWIICCGLRSHLISIERLWESLYLARHRSLHHHHKNIKWGNILGKNGVHPSSRVPDSHWSCPPSFRFSYKLYPNCVYLKTAHRNVRDKDIKCDIAFHCYYRWAV